MSEGVAPAVQFQDDLATGGVCDADEVKVFRADGIGEIDGSRLFVTYADGGGCGLLLVPIGGMYNYDGNTDTLRDSDGVIWTRIPDGHRARRRPFSPAPSRRPGPTHASACIDLAQGGTYTAPASGKETAPAGPLQLTATVPGAPANPWRGLREWFLLSSSCEVIAPITFYARLRRSVNATSCMPEALEITTLPTRSPGSTRRW